MNRRYAARSEVPPDVGGTSPAVLHVEVLEGLSDGRTRRTLRQLTVGWLRWHEAHNSPVTTIASYRDALSSFLTFTAGRITYPDEATVLLFDAFYAWLRERGRRPSTVAHRRSTLISFWRWLEHEGFADRNIPAKTYPIKTPKRLPVYLEPHQIDTFLAKLAALPEPIDQRDHAITATFFYSGVRVSELAALQLSEVDLTAARIRVNQGKGGQDRVLYIPPRLAPILQRYLVEVRPVLVAGRDMPWLFVPIARGHRGRPLSRDLLTRSLCDLIQRRARSLLGVKLSPHKLRHTCASYLLYHGASLETIQRVLGHKDIRTTMIYLHLPQRRQEEEIKTIFGHAGDRP